MVNVKRIAAAAMTATMAMGGMAMPTMAQTRTCTCKKASKKKSSSKRRTPKKYYSKKRAPKKGKNQARVEVKGQSYDKKSQYSNATETGTVYSLVFDATGANANKTVYQTDTNYATQAIQNVKTFQAGPRYSTTNYQKNDKTDKVDTKYQSDTIGLKNDNGLKVYQNSVNGQDGHDNAHSSETNVHSYSVRPSYWR